ncbi:MAG: tetratricopeptide repeat protein [Gemmatimonadetes bacterium]|nr:tetratricopeptide repeat protein [Gemmatimonadota bacterium]MBT6147793.1 tetratricopeptide repeat protein [Gemmatimonadota bacterium]MBT7861369.1 tetratricopeptide repeat protein [Gemmatimonadota bacterium]
MSDPGDKDASDKIALYRSGMNKYATQDFEGARQDFEAALQIDPEFGDIHHSLAHVFDKLEDTEQALVSARRAVELNPEEILAYTTLSVMCMRKGLIQEAEDAKARAADLQRQADGSS